MHRWAQSVPSDQAPPAVARPLLPPEPRLGSAQTTTSRETTPPLSTHSIDPTANAIWPETLPPQSRAQLGAADTAGAVVLQMLGLEDWDIWKLWHVGVGDLGAGQLGVGNLGAGQLGVGDLGAGILGVLAVGILVEAAVCS